MPEVVVIGGGHNGLAAAALLAKAGHMVTLLEREEMLGGLAAGEEFAPGYRTTGTLHDTTRLSSEVVEELELERHGLRRDAERPAVLFPERDGPGLLIGGNRAAARREIAHLSGRDAARYGDYCDFIDRARPVLSSLWNQAPPDLGDPSRRASWGLALKGVGLRRLGRRAMLELLRATPMCAADWLNEWFETELLKAGLAGPAVLGTHMGPRSAGSNINLLFWESVAQGAVAGGGAALIRALEAGAREHGVEIRTGCEVARLFVRGGQVQGVALAGGEEIGAPSVVATCDPKRTFLELLAPEALSRRLEHRIDVFRARGTTSVVHLALSAALEFSSRPGQAIELARTGGSLDEIERAFDLVKYRRFPESPLLEIHVPTVSQPELAPPGHSVVSMLVHYTPFDLEGGWSDARREELGDLALSTLERYAPGAREALVARKVLTPIDLAQRHALTGGHLHHGEVALDQLFMRPSPETARYATPIEGLFLGGGGSHPGGGITATPGRLAAGAIGVR